jgi:hypothetical protein
MRMTESPERSTTNAAFDPQGVYTVVNIANTGRRPVTIGVVWFSQRTDGAGDLALDETARVGPRELAEGQSAAYLINQADFPGADLDSVFVRDQGGKIWQHRVPEDVRRAYASVPPPR